MPSRTILLVDSDPLQRQLVDMLLAEDGPTIVNAGSGREALEYLKEHTPHLAIMALELPDIGGDVVCGKLKSVTRLARVPVLLTVEPPKRTGIATDVRERARSAGADLVLPKPLGDKNLRQRVRHLLARWDTPAVEAGRSTKNTMIIEQALEALGEDGPGPGGPGPDGPARDASGTDGPAAAGRSAPGRDAPGRDVSGRDGPGQDARGQDGRGQDGRGQDGRSRGAEASPPAEALYRENEELRREIASLRRTLARLEAERPGGDGEAGANPHIVSGARPAEPSSPGHRSPTDGDGPTDEPSAARAADEPQDRAQELEQRVREMERRNKALLEALEEAKAPSEDAPRGLFRRRRS